MKLYSIILLILAGKGVFATDNKYYILPDTVHVEEVVVSGNSINRYQVGAKVEKIEARIFDANSDASLDEVLFKFTPVSIKTMAGSFSMIRFRGTSPNHTSVNFGGLNINSLTLGETNFGNVPVYLFDELGVQYGSSSAVNGSGSIGGAIHLGLKSHWVNGIKGEVRLTHGSFGEQLTGFKYYSGNGKFESVTRGYWYSKENNFTFFNPNYRDVEAGIRGKTDVQKNANIDNKGIIQELNFKIAPNHFVKSKVWIENDWHLIQQNMATNLKDTLPRETLEDQNLRVWIDYENNRNIIKYKLGAGGARDLSRYNNTLQPIITNRIESEGNIEFNISDNSSVKAGFDFSRITPEVKSYDELLEYEDRIDLFLQYRHELFNNKLRTTLNLRKGYVTGFIVPFTPAWGLSYLLYSGEKTLLKLNGNISYSYRVPTFNDRFWKPGGNPNLKPEKGFNYELGAKYSYCDGAKSGNIKLNWFYMDIDNWVLWKPGGSFWYATNAERVISQGVELQTDVTVNVFNSEINGGLVFSYNPVSRKEVLNMQNIAEAKLIGRQMEYVPLYTGSAFVSYNIRNWSIGYDVRFNPWQYTDGTEENFIDGYLLFNANAGYTLNISPIHIIKFRGHINNILNTNYQSSYGYAMPGRSYRISITYNFN